MFSLDLVRWSGLLILTLLTACATQPELIGPYASRLSLADIEQIRLTASREFHTRRLLKLEASRANYVLVTACGNIPCEYVSLFDLIRRGDRWMVAESTAPGEARRVNVE